MQTDDSFPYVEVPDEALAVVGERMEGTRIYEQWGSPEDGAHYLDFISRLYGGLVSPGRGSEIVGVTRAAVHKRMKAGKLTAFLYRSSIDRIKLGPFKVPDAKVTPCCYIPTSELLAWREEILNRARAKIEAMTTTESDESMSFMCKSIRDAKRELKKRGIQIYRDR